MAGENEAADVTAGGYAAEQATQQDANQNLEATSTSEPGDASGEEARKAAEKQRNGATKRIDELTAQRRAAERERDYWREQAIQKKPAQQHQEQRPQQQQEADLKPENFPSYEAYLEAKAEAKAEAVFQRRMEQQRREQEQREAGERDNRARTSLNQQFDAARERLEDFDEVVFSDSVPISPAMTQAIAESDMAADVAYFLGKNPEEARRISQLSPLAQAREIGRIEARISAQPKPQPKPVSTVTPVRGQSGQFAKDPSKMTDAEWAASRNRK